jgi:hypothetical protein
MAGQRRNVVGVCFIAAGLLACGAEADPPPQWDDTAAPAVQPQQPAGSVSADMVALDGSGIEGSVMVDTAADRPVITVSLRNAAEGVHQGHIHGGSCADRTRALVPLEPVAVGADGSGSSTSTVDMPADELFDGNHIVVYHEAHGAPGASVACAELRRG